MTMFWIAFEAKKDDRLFVSQISRNPERILSGFRLNMRPKYFLKRSYVSTSHSLATLLRIAERFQMRIFDALLGQCFTQAVLRKARTARSRHIPNVDDPINLGVDQCVEKIAKRRSLVTDGVNLPLHNGVSFANEEPASIKDWSSGTKYATTESKMSQHMARIWRNFSDAL